MKWILPVGTQLELQGVSSPVQILRGLGGGSQGQVFEVAVQDQHAALKWYYPACMRLDPELRDRLTQCIRAGSPTDGFLWPLALLHGHQGLSQHGELVSEGFGYLMRIRSPDYVPAVDHYAGRLQLSIAAVIGVCLRLCASFHALHSKGFCYKDISMANLFMDPNDGRILICDNDNVGVEGLGASAVLGTPGYMAPEVLLRQAPPSQRSDLFSLAVLIFRLLTRHDPFRGLLESSIPCLDEQACIQLYGKDPVFIFNPQDARNRPDPSSHPYPLLTWPIYPEALQSLFIQTFVNGLRNPSKRAMTSEWMKQLAATLDGRLLCGTCGQENFLDRHATSAHCWHCQTPIAPELIIKLEHCQVAVAKGNHLYPHHFNRLSSISIDAPIGVMVANPNRQDVIGLTNLTSKAWTAELISGDTLLVPPGKTTNLALTASLATELGSMTVLKR